MNEKTEIDMTKKYKTRNGLPVRVVCTDMQDEEYPVIALVKNTDGEAPLFYTKYGKFINYGDDDDDEYENDLIEVTPWDDFKIDDPVMVRDCDYKQWSKRCFAGVYNGYPQAFCDGKTSWTSNGSKTSWEQCRKPTPEELKC